MRIRRLLLPVSLTACLALLACRVLSFRVPVHPAENTPGVTVRFDGEQARRHLDSLTHRFKGRVIGSAQGFAAAEYVAERFRSYGLRTESQDFREAGASSNGSEYGWFRGRNVIGVLPGHGEGTVVISAHRDCVAKAPEGAYDDASGTAITMELARVLAAGAPHRYTFVFAALDGEEIGLAGARVLMNNPPAALKDIRLMINFDMVGFNGDPMLGAAHTQYLSPEARALVATRFMLPPYALLQFPLGRGTDAQLYVLRGLPTLDVREIMPRFTRIINHDAGDTYGQVSAVSMQRAGRAVEQLMLQGDAMGAFTPTRGLAASSSAGVLPTWSYVLGGACILALFALPLLFRLRSAAVETGRSAQITAALILSTWALTSISARWRGTASFAAVPLLGAVALLVLQVVAVRRAKQPGSGLGRVLVAAAPLLLFTGTWLLTGLWPLGFWTALVAYLPAALVTWKRGWRWRTLDVVLLLPALLLTWLLALISWLLAPLHFFPSAKLPFFTAIYFAAALACIWGIFERRGMIKTELITSGGDRGEPA